MERRSAVWILAAILLEALMSAEAQNSEKFLEVGGKLVLEPERVSEPLTSLSWKFNGGIVAEWNAETLPLDITAAFKGRTNVSTITGVLEINNLMKTDSGKYTVEINDILQSGGHDVRVIQRVPKPAAIMRPLTCNKESKSCSLSCDGVITDAGPVTFYFKKGDGDWKERKQNIEIINDDETQAVETFSCRMKNPLGQKDSEPVKNPFYVEPNPGKIVGIVFGVLALVALVVGGVGVGVVGGLRYKKQREKANGNDQPRAPSPNNNANHPENALLKDMSPGYKEGV